MKITYVQAHVDGCSYYRGILPLEIMEEKGEISLNKIERGDSAIKISKSLDTDIVFLPRIISGTWIDRLPDLKSIGCKVITDYDDNFFSVHPLSAHYGDFGTKEHNATLDNGKTIKLWEDGKNDFDIKRNLEKLEKIKESIGKMDLVTVENINLYNVLKEYNKNIEIIPNYIDLKIWNKLPLKKETDEIKLYWSGGSSHYYDWKILEGVLPEIFDKYKNVKLVIMGTLFGGLIKNIPKDRIEYHKWEDVTAYPYKSAIINADISLIPLQGNDDFNICKSPIKWIEQSALEIPSIVSMVDPYTRCYNGSNMLMIEDNCEQGWFDAICMMIEDPLLRINIGTNARKYVENNCDIRKNTDKRLEYYRRLIDGT